MERVGLEACSLTAWLNTALTDAGIPAICIEARQAKAAMGAMPNKTDRNDARGLLDDEIPFDGDAIDLGEAAAEQLALALDHTRTSPVLNCRFHLIARTTVRSRLLPRCVPGNSFENSPRPSLLPNYEHWQLICHRRSIAGCFKTHDLDSLSMIGAGGITRTVNHAIKQKA